jgi:hypothetical protein
MRFRNSMFLDVVQQKQARSVAIHRAARAIGPDAASVQTSGRRSARDKPSAEHEIEPRLSIVPRLEEQEQQSVAGIRSSGVHANPGWRKKHSCTAIPSRLLLVL